MITEDYVSFKTAKLLKEKGFNEEVRTFYNSKGVFEDCAFPLNHNLDIGSGFTSAPSQSLALKWLREVHNIILGINPNDHDGSVKWKIEAYKVYEQNGCFLHEGIWIIEAFLPLYEQAVEAALKYVLENLI